MMSKKKNKQEKENGTAQDPTMESQAIDDQVNASGSDEETDNAGDQELQETKDKYLRLLAEFENYKKRTFREKLDTISTAARDTMMAILPVLDDFDRAKMMSDDESTEEQFSEGVVLVYNKLKSVLEHKGLRVMESTGQPFDAELHEAVTEIPAPGEDQKGVIIDTIEKGYTLNDKIIRHAKVVVGK